MAIFRQYVAPLLVVLLFLVSLLVVSARIFLPQDMAAPAPVEKVSQQPTRAIANDLPSLPPTLKLLIQGLPEDLGSVPQL
jgi:hypothetical protein